MNKHKHIYFTYILCLLVSALMLNACTEDLDIADADPTIGLDMGLALPGGTISTTLGDFLGGTDLAILQPDENGLYKLAFDTIITQNFEVPPLEDNFISTQQTFHIADYYETTLRPAIVDHYNSQYGNYLPYPIPEDIPFDELQKLIQDYLGVDLVIPQGTYDFSYDMSLSLSGTDLEKYQDLDSIHLDQMIFTSLFEPIGIVLEPEEMSELSIEFDELFRFEDGKQKRELQITPAIFGQGLQVTFENIMVRMPRHTGGTLDDVRLTVHFKLDLKEPKTFDQETALNYKFAGDRMAFDIIYGMYQPEEPIATADAINIGDMLPIDLAEMKLPFAEPAITLGFYTGTIGMPTDLLIDEIYTQDASGNKKQATFNGQPANRQALPYITDPASTKTDTAWIYLSNDPAQGNLNQLFTITPEKLGYAFRLEIDEEQILENEQKGIASFMKAKLDLGIKMHMELPMVFDPGVSLAYSDTMDLDLGNLSGDTASTGIIDTLAIKQVVLKMAITNEIPFNIDAKLNFMDDNNNIIPIGDGQALSFTIAGNDGKTPKISEVTLRLTDEDAAKLNKVTQVKYDFKLGDNTVKAALKSTSGLKIRFSLGTQIGATINLGQNTVD